MRVLQRTVAAVAVCLALAGCQDDGTEPTAGSSTTGTSTDEQPTAAPAATGPAIRGDSFTLHVPEGWTYNKDYSTDFIDQYSSPTSIEQMHVTEISGEVRPLDEVAEANFEGFAPAGTKRKRLSGATVAGEPAYHLTANGGYGKFVEEFGVIKDGQQVTFGITLTGSRADRQAVIDSVLASWEWT